ncbi:MAG: hypothetical protein ACRCUU_04145, partial [Plesiomonas sp.]
DTAVSNCGCQVRWGHLYRHQGLGQKKFDFTPYQIIVYCRWDHYDAAHSDGLTRHTSSARRRQIAQQAI